MTATEDGLPLLWVDGRVRDSKAAVFFASDRGATLGDGVFDTAFCANGRVFDRTAHKERLQASCKVLGYHFDADLLTQAYDLASQTRAEAILRVAISRGPGTRGLGHDPNQRAQVTAQLLPMPADLRFRDITLDVADFSRNAQSLLSHHKTAGYLDAIVAMSTAQDRGADDALFLNGEGHVTCTTMANVFAITGGEILTPPLSDGVLPGVMRALILRQSANLGLTPREKSVTIAALAAADEGVVTNSLRLIVPVRNFGSTAMTHRQRLANAVCTEIRDQIGLNLPGPQWA